MLKARQKKRIRPEARRAYHEQGEINRKVDEGPNPLILQNHGMTCGKR